MTPKQMSIGDLASAGVLEFGDGYRTKRSEHGQPGYRIIRVADVLDDVVKLDGPDFVSEEYAGKIGDKIGQPGDILLTTKGTVGRVAVMPSSDDPVVYSPQLCFFRVIDNAKLNPRFLRYWFSSHEFWEQASYRMNNTDMAAYINLADIRSMKISLPSPVEQQNIVEVLGALDDKIVVNTKLADTTDTFIQFSFKDALQSSPTTREPLLDVFRFEFGEAFKGEYFVEPGAGRPLIRIRDLKTFSPQVWTMEARPKEILVEAGDVVVGMDAEFRATSWLGERGLLNQRVCRVTSDLAGNAFVREALREPLANIENYKTGTTVIHLNKKDLKSTSVVLPSKQAISSFENSTEELYSLRVALAAENRTLAETRDALLPQLMAGKLRVKDAEKVLEDVL